MYSYILLDHVVGSIKPPPPVITAAQLCCTHRLAFRTTIWCFVILLLWVQWQRAHCVWCLMYMPGLHACCMLKVRQSYIHCRLGVMWCIYAVIPACNTFICMSYWVWPRFQLQVSQLWFILCAFRQLSLVQLTFAAQIRGNMHCREIYF